MELTFTGQRMLLASVTARSEVHGEDREPASDVGLKADVPNDVLAVFHPDLKAAMYRFDESRPQDLVDQGKSREPGYLPHLKFPMLRTPLNWDGEIVNAKVKIRRLGEPEKNDVILTPAKVNKFAFELHDGGTVGLSFRVQYKPDEAQAGKLAMLVQQDVEVSLEILPEEEPQQGFAGE